MTLKLLHLNIFQGKLIDSIIDFVESEKFDILNFQEVTGGQFSRGGINQYPEEINFYNASINQEAVGIDCFHKIKKGLGYRGVKAVNFNILNDKASYTGNATFYNGLKLVSSEIIRMKPIREYINLESIDVPALPRSALALKFDINGKQLTVINAHLAWGPTSKDESYKLEQAKILLEYVKKIKTPFLLSGDFNLDSESKVVSWFSEIAINLTLKNNITNTLNPRIHSVKKLFPKGIPVDYIFTSNDIKVRSFKLIDQIDLSDHFGLSLEFEI